MSLFNSLGSNYNLNFVIKSLIYSNNSMYHGELEKFLQDKYGGNVVLLYKGREAIELALKISNLPKNSYVAINGFTCFALYEAIKNAGLSVEYLDLENGDLNFSAETLKKAVVKNPKIKTVIIQNTLGYPCQIEEIKYICQKNDIVLIEDLAHSIGTKYSDGTEAGTVGDCTVLSFSQDKMIDGVSGGALISNLPVSSLHLEGVSIKQQAIDRLYPLSTYLIRKTYPFGIGKILHFALKNLKLLSSPMDGGKGIHKLPSWYSNLVIQQFNNLNNNLNHRKAVASLYAKLVNPKILAPKLVKQIPLSTNLRFPIFVENREGLIKFLAENQIYVSDIWYDGPIAPKKYLSQTDYAGQCPNAQLASDEILNLPTHINVSEKDAENISNLVNLWLKSK